LGLLVSGLASPQKTLGFLQLIPLEFDPLLLMAVLFGVVPNYIEILINGYNLPSSAAVPNSTYPPPRKFL
jgi:hypothetical protein